MLGGRMVTVEQAIDNAARLLGWAESQTDLALMHQITDLADSWTTIAQVITQNEHA